MGVPVQLLRPSAALGLAIAVALAGCEARPSSPSPHPSAVGSGGVEVETIPAQDAVAGVQALQGGFDCGEPVPRTDDFGWVCEGSRQELEATIHLYAREVEGAIFGATLVVQADVDGAPDERQVAEEAEALALVLVGVAVPEAWREPAARWIGEHMPEGGRTLDVPDAGITASVQPLAQLQWYVEVYELDGLES